ncbi:MAG TPA: reverse gyrase [Thermotogae bacterium]|nr:reverse gyrase [Thermotogota bacterium]
MRRKKREYFLRGGIDFTTATDELLYTTKVKEKEYLKDWFLFYHKRRKTFRHLGFETPNAYQRYWLYQRFKNGSIIMNGPVGIGKTTFALVESLHCEGRSMVIVPTRTLAENIFERLTVYEEKIRMGKKISLYTPDTKENIIKGDFDVAVLTSQAFRLLYSQVSWKASLSIVDDVDAFVKNPRNLDRVLDMTDGSVILSSATFKASPKQKKKLVEKFRISFKTSRSVGFRNIEDLYSEAENEEDLYDELTDFIKHMGPGGLIFLPRGTDENQFIEQLEKRGIRAEKGDEKTLKLLENGNIDVLVGKAAFYGVLVRGIDLPDSIRYTVFSGVPRGEFVLKKDEDHSRWWKMFFKDKLPESWDEIKNRIVETAPQRAWSVEETEEGLKITYPDITTYIQASGRTSRFTGSSFTFGVSLLLETNKNILYAFLRKASLYGIAPKLLSDADLNVLREKTIISRKETDKASITFKSYLMLVESPHKIETIASLLGGGVFRYITTPGGWTMSIAEVAYGTTLFVIGATIGHTSDIVETAPDSWPHKTVYGVSVEETGYYPIMDTIKMSNGTAFVLPQNNNDYRDKLDLIKVYRELLLAVDGLLIATDPDSEGERIAYEVGAYLKPFTEKLKRMEFREITRKALMAAINSTRNIDTKRVEAALTRRIEDRWVGFFLSEQLMKHLKRSGISGGRVQSPVLGWIIERYTLSRRKKTMFRVLLPFLEGFELETENRPPEMVTIKNVRLDTADKNPLPPYTTDSMLADASRILKFSVSHTMNLAQDLFEEGFITYHRTDSTRVSDDGMKVAQIYLKERFGEDMFSGRRWGIPSSEHAQQAHECIRPTKPVDAREFWEIAPSNFTKDHGKLYGLIFRRFMASQSTPAKIKTLSFTIESIDSISVPVEIVKEGYLKLYTDQKIYPLKHLPEEGETVRISIEEISKPLAYPLKEEDVIRMMKEKAIGRPSTYGKILEVIKTRNYVRVSQKGFLIPTKLGIAVWNFLSKNYRTFVSEERTAELYRKMDAIEEGRQKYMELLKGIWNEIFS